MRLLPILTAVSIASFAFVATANAQGMNGNQNGMSPNDNMGHSMMHKKMHMKHSMMHEKTHMKHSMMHKRMMSSDQHM